jgi:proteasome lid subunit RPN8/RPN11
MGTDDPLNIPFIDQDSDDLKIELSDVDRAPVHKQRPLIRGWLGSQRNTASPHFYLRADAAEDLLRHALSVTDREVGGVLVGTVHRDDDAFVLAVGAIPAKYAGEARANLTFTQASWQYVLAEQQQQFPGTVMVGWYHTHPGYGLFLSEQDLYIHRSFFSLPFQLAIVVDPLSCSLAAFHLMNNRMCKETSLPVYGGPVDWPHYADQHSVSPSTPIHAHDEPGDTPTLASSLAELRGIADEIRYRVKPQLDQVAQIVEEQFHTAKPSPHNGPQRKG